MAVQGGAGAGWRSPCVVMGAGAMLGSGALATSGRGAVLAGLFFAGAVFLLIIGTFGSRLLRGKVELGTAGKFEFELQEAREVTTSIAADAQRPDFELGPNEEDDATRLILAELLLRRLLIETSDPVADCRFQLYLHDPDLSLLQPVLDPGHPGASPGFPPHQGTVGEAWATGEYVIATGPSASDETFNLSPEQRERYSDVTVAAAVPVTNAGGRIIGVVSGFSRDEDSALARHEGFVRHVFLAEAAARVLIDLLKWVQRWVRW